LKDISFNVGYSGDLRCAVYTAKQILMSHPGVKLPDARGCTRTAGTSAWCCVVNFGSPMRRKSGGNSIRAFFRVIRGGRASALGERRKRGEMYEPESPKAWVGRNNHGDDDLVFVGYQPTWMLLPVQGLRGQGDIHAALSVQFLSRAG
jgi:hypothetical protein